MTRDDEGERGGHNIDTGAILVSSCSEEQRSVDTKRSIHLIANLTTTLITTYATFSFLTRAISEHFSPCISIVLLLLAVWRNISNKQLTHTFKFQDKGRNMKAPLQPSPPNSLLFIKAGLPLILFSVGVRIQFPQTF